MGVPQPKPVLTLEEYGGHGSFKLGPWEPIITVSIGGQPVNFLIDMGASFSVLERCLGSLAKKKYEM